MNTIFEAYDLPVTRLVALYQRLNQVITYPDGMTTSLGIIYWGRTEHLDEIKKAIPVLVDNGRSRFSDVWHATRTPVLARKLAEQTGIPQQILRILKHDLELWLPKEVPLAQLEWFRKDVHRLKAFTDQGLEHQLALISAGQTLVLRERLSLQTHLDMETMHEAVKLCDHYRMGKNLEHIRARIYYAMGMDTWQKWEAQTAEGIIALFNAYIQENPLMAERLVPWPKEVRNAIEWAKMHLEIYTVQW